MPTVLAFVIILFLLGQSNMAVARGIRNNNPFNLKEGPNDSTAWLGEHSDDLDPTFEEFGSPIFGIRAGVRTIANYYRLYGINTIRGIITRFAPSTENNTRAYIDHVSEVMNLPPDEPFDVLNPNRMLQLATVIIHHENGQQPYPIATLERGVTEGLA